MEGWWQIMSKLKSYQELEVWKKSIDWVGKIYLVSKSLPDEEKFGLTSQISLVARLVVYLIGLNRGRRIADSLAEAWLRQGKYENARALIEAAVTEDQIVGGDGNLMGINVMTMHKSKGKEFDGVIVLHLGNNISPLCSDYEPEPRLKSRRLLRVGITRAKYHVLMLTDAYNPSPLLQGHRL